MMNNNIIVKSKGRKATSTRCRVSVPHIQLTVRFGVFSSLSQSNTFFIIVRHFGAQLFSCWWTFKWEKYRCANNTKESAIEIKQVSRASASTRPGGSMSSSFHVCQQSIYVDCCWQPSSAKKKHSKEVYGFWFLLFVLCSFSFHSTTRNLINIFLCFTWKNSFTDVSLPPSTLIRIFFINLQRPFAVWFIKIAQRQVVSYECGWCHLFFFFRVFLFLSSLLGVALLRFLFVFRARKLSRLCWTDVMKVDRCCVLFLARKREREKDHRWLRRDWKFFSRELSHVCRKYEVSWSFQFAWFFLRARLVRCFSYSNLC